MPDENDDTSQLVDDDVITEAYPPERPLGVDERLTAIEEQSGESFGHRVAREDRGDGAEPDRGVGQLIRPGGDQFVDDEDAEVAIDLRDRDETLWDTTLEREGELSAEEAAMHLTAEPPMGDGDGYLED